SAVSASAPRNTAAAPPRVALFRPGAFTAHPSSSAAPPLEPPPAPPSSPPPAPPVVAPPVVAPPVVVPPVVAPPVLVVAPEATHTRSSNSPSWHVPASPSRSVHGAPSCCT